MLALGACVAIFTCLGAWLGAILKRTLAAVPLLFGLAMPFYVDSGALEPTRFDGEAIWIARPPVAGLLRGRRARVGVPRPPGDA